VDFSGTVDDEFLKRLGLEKGTRKVVNHEERGRVLRAMDGCSYKAAAGGSLSNSLVALARLGCKSVGGPALNVAMAGSVGSDPLGGFYRLKFNNLFSFLLLFFLHLKVHERKPELRLLIVGYFFKSMISVFLVLFFFNF
jgi:hypothetical protein